MGGGSVDFFEGDLVAKVLTMLTVLTRANREIWKTYITVENLFKTLDKVRAMLLLLRTRSALPCHEPIRLPPGCQTIRKLTGILRLVCAFEIGVRRGRGRLLECRVRHKQASHSNGLEQER